MRAAVITTVSMTVHCVQTIFTWGDALMTQHELQQLGSQLDVNAKPLEGRGGGADTHFNALQDSSERANCRSTTTLPPLDLVWQYSESQ